MANNYDRHDEAFLEKVATYGMDCNPVEEKASWYRVSFINDQDDDSGAFPSLEGVEDFAEEMMAEGFACEIEEARVPSPGGSPDADEQERNEKGGQTMV